MSPVGRSQAGPAAVRSAMSGSPARGARSPSLRQREALPALGPALALRSEARGGSLRDAPRWVFWLLMVFFVLEYARPPLITELKFQLLFIALFPLVWLNHSERRWSATLTLQAGLLAACALSAPFATNNFWAYMMTRAIYGHWILALAITWVLARRSNFVWAIWFWVAIMAYQGLYSIGHEGMGAGGFLQDENDLALGCATAFPFAFLGIRCFSGWKRALCAGLTLLLAIAIVVSWSRGGFVGLAATTLYCAWTGRNRVRTALLCVVAALVFLALAPASYKAELLTIKDTHEATANTRLFLWTAGFNMWKANPILGVGAGNSSWRVGEFQPKGKRWDLPEYTERDWTMKQLHSVYFQTLSELGLVGVTLFAALIVLHFRTLRGLRRSAARDPTLSPAARAEIELYAVGLAGAMVAYLAAGAFLSVFSYPYPWYLSAMAVALSRAAPEFSRQPAGQPGLGAEAVGRLSHA